MSQLGRLGSKVVVLSKASIQFLKVLPNKLAKSQQKALETLILELFTVINLLGNIFILIIFSEHNSTIIVMLTKLKEMGKEKCKFYKVLANRKLFLWRFLNRGKEAFE